MFAVKSFVDRPDKSTLLCSHCKKKGHDVSSCFKIHGKPLWYEEKFGKASKSAAGSSRFSSDAATGSSLASSADATARPASVVRAHAITGPIPGASTPPAAANGSPSLASLSPAQMQVLLNLVNDKSSENMMGESLSSSWLLDTGASHHVTGNALYLIDVISTSAHPVGLPDGRTVLATKTGSVKLAGGLILKNVLFVPQLHCNLISVSQLIDDSHGFVRFTDSLCAIQDLRSGSLIGACERKDGLYYYRGIPTVCAVTVSDISVFELWHRRLGHPSDKVVKLLPAISNSSCRKHLSQTCIVCPQAKQSRPSFPISYNKASRMFELIHCDLWGPYKTPSSCGAHYFLTLVDDFTRATWVYLLKCKTEVHKSFCSFFAMIERQFEVTVKMVRSENGTEFNCMLDYFTTNGIIFQTTCGGTPQQNGRVERKHRHILNVSRALMFQANLPVSFRGECVLGAVYLINRTPSRLLLNKTPYEALFGVFPDFDELKVFGSLCFAHN